MSSNLKVLLADDNRDHIELITEILNQELKAEVEGVTTGEECLKKVSQTRYDLLLLDYLFPKINGLDILKEIVEKDYDLPVIMITGHGSEKVAVEAMKTGAIDYIVKSEDGFEALPSAAKRAIEKSRLKKKLKESEEEIRDLAKFPSENPYPVLRISKEGIILYANDNSLSLLGEWGTSLNQSAPDYLRQLVTEVLNTGLTKNIEIEHQGRILSFVVVPIYNTDYVNFYGRDITERKKAEEDIKQSAREWETTFNSITDLVSIQNKDLKLIRVNKACADLFRARPEELIGKTCYEVFHGTKEPLPNCPHLRALETKKTASTEFFDSRFEIHFEVSASPLFNKEGEVFGTVHIAKDITQRKRLQEQLIQTEKLAAVGTLAYGIAHEFNNILAGMMANAELGLITREPEQVKECFETIVESSQRASSITNNLLAFARQKEARKELTDITEPLKSVLSITKRELEKFNIEIVEKFKPVPKIYCDAGQLSEVFLNMVTNARDAMHPKGGALNIEVESVGDNIRIIFKDTGCGIPEEIKGKIFEPFVTTKGALGKSEIPGTGLGLFLSYGIIDGYKGKIEVETKVGRGTKFTIQIPVSKNLPREFLLDTRIESSKETERKLKILLVDDESPICSSLKKFLESKGHLVATSLRGKEGLEFFKKDKFDLVLSDITMPDMDGIELIKKMKDNDSKTRIIVITGHIEKEKEEKAREAGADEVLIKPFKNELLYQTISKIVI